MKASTLSARARSPFALGLAVAVVSVAVVLTVPPGGAEGAAVTAPAYCVGAAKADITPPAAMLAAGGFYLGGYGIGPQHPAHSVLRDLYTRVLAIGVPVGGSCRAGGADQVVIAAADLQGHFLAYQQGPYGFADMEAHVSSALHIPVSHLLIQSTHTHNGPDDLGIWGGVPNAYLAEVTTRTESAIQQAVGSERLATMRWATIDMTGFSATFPDQSSGTGGDFKDYPIDRQLRVLQATSVAHGAVIATLVDYSSHATVYGPLDKVSPDWPGAAASYLENDEVGDPGTGYPGSVAVVAVGAVGHAWPASVPKGEGAPNLPSAKTDDNFGADSYGDAVAHRAMTALAAKARPLTGTARVGGAGGTLTVVSWNPALTAVLLVPVPGLHAYRSDTPPYGAGDVIFTEDKMLRVGDLAMMSAPGEPYPSVESTLSTEIRTAVLFPFGLADDQLGYISQPGDFSGALQCSTTDEGFFTLSPTFGDDLEAAQRANARSLGFEVHDPGAVSDVNVGALPPPTTCTREQVP